MNLAGYELSVATSPAATPMMPLLRCICPAAHPGPPSDVGVRTRDRAKLDPGIHHRSRRLTRLPDPHRSVSREGADGYAEPAIRPARAAARDRHGARARRPVRADVRVASAREVLADIGRSSDAATAQIGAPSRSRRRRERSTSSCPRTSIRAICALGRGSKNAARADRCDAYVLGCRGRCLPASVSMRSTRTVRLSRCLRTVGCPVGFHPMASLRYIADTRVASATRPDRESPGGCGRGGGT